MPKYDVSGVVEQAQKAIEDRDNQSNGNNSDYDYNILYPFGEGTIRVKLLYNPKDNVAMRKIVRHQVGGTKNPCLQYYGEECKTCKTVDNIKSVTGSNLWRLNPKTRGLAYAQFIDSDYSGKDAKNLDIEEGEIVLLMFPWTVYTQIQEIISEAGDRAHHILTENKGKILKITRKRKKKRVKYTAQLEAFDDYQSFDKDEEFYKALEELPALSDKLMPSKATDEVVKKDMELAKQLESEYLSDKVDKRTTDEEDEEESKKKDKKEETKSEEKDDSGKDTSKSKDSSKPKCFGSHEEDEDDCLLCPHEVTCKEETEE